MPHEREARVRLLKIKQKDMIYADYVPRLLAYLLNCSYI